MHTWRLRETAGSIIDGRYAVFLWVSRAVAHTVKLIVLHTRTAFIVKRSMAAALNLDSPNIMLITAVLI
jgi:hypothetical protein